MTIPTDDQLQCFTCRVCDGRTEDDCRDHHPGGCEPLTFADAFLHGRGDSGERAA